MWIIEVKFEELCVFFEEVVGVLKYKECCCEIENCLYDMCENLMCVEDIVCEFGVNFEKFEV